VTTLVKRGTARRLGLRTPHPLHDYYLWAMADCHVATPPFYRLRLSHRLPRADGIVYTGETRLA
jgi:hypothetical protein